MGWRIEAPFSISPLTASLEPGEAAVFQVSFAPLEACSYEVNAAVQLDTGAGSLVKVSSDAVM